MVFIEFIVMELNSMKGNDIIIETPRLIIKAIQPESAATIYKYKSDPRVNKYQGWEAVSFESVFKFINDNLDTEFNLADNWKQFGIYSKKDDTLFGDIGLHFLNPQNGIVEIGFTLGYENQGFGYGGEAVKSVIYFLFTILKKHRIIASVDPQNTRSISLLKRAGLNQEAYFKKSLFIKGNWVDDIIFALLNEDYKPDESECNCYNIKY